MVSAATRAPVSPQDYLAFERSAAAKHELWRGEVFAMAGASFAHNRIAANLLAELRDALANGACVALPSDMKVHVPSREGFVYPDASIVCGAPEFLDATSDVLTNPSAVFEVLSDSTEASPREGAGSGRGRGPETAFDRGAKFVGYRSIASLRECVLISQHERRVEQYPARRRQLGAARSRRGRQRHARGRRRARARRAVPQHGDLSRRALGAQRAAPA